MLEFVKNFIEKDFFKNNYVFLVKYVFGPLFRFRRKFLPRKAVLYVGQSYYHAWNCSHALRKLGWRADVLNWDMHEGSQIYYHGEDFRFTKHGEEGYQEQLDFYLKALWKYDIFHFSNIGGMVFGFPFQLSISEKFHRNFEIEVLRYLGKKIVYSNSGCLDGVSQTTFSQWPPASVCSICVWRTRPDVCSDEKNLSWGKYRNQMADYQCLIGGNHGDYNDDPRVHEEPEFYCIDPDLLHPDLEVPARFKKEYPQGTICLYHAVGNLKDRTDDSGVNIKSTHVYLPLIDRLRSEGYPIELLSVTDVPNRDVRFYQVQADIFLDMLSFGFFGANGREALMLGKPLVCFLRPEWLESMRAEIPEYVDELPVVNATPETVYDVVKDLIENPEKRAQIGRRSRAFALKWHSTDAAGRRMDRVYRRLLRDQGYDSSRAP